MQTQDHSYKSPDVVRFLQILLREIPGKLLVIWDGAPIHRAQVIKGFLAKGGARRIHLERLPAYAPELNPQEGVWNLLKRVELKNICCLDVQHVQRELRRAKERLRHRKSVLRQCFAHAGCFLWSFMLKSLGSPMTRKKCLAQDHIYIDGCDCLLERVGTGLLPDLASATLSNSLRKLRHRGNTLLDSPYETVESIVSNKLL